MEGREGGREGEDAELTFGIVFRFVGPPLVGTSSLTWSIRPHLAREGPSMARFRSKLARRRPFFARCRPNVVHIRPNVCSSGRNLVEVRHLLADIDRIWPILARSRPKSVVVPRAAGASRSLTGHWLAEARGALRMCGCSPMLGESKSARADLMACQASLRPSCWAQVWLDLRHVGRSRQSA